MPSAAAAAVPATPAPPSTQAAPAPAAPKLLRHILIADSVESAIKLTAAPDSPFVVMAPAFAKLDLAEINKRLASGLNQPIEERILAAIAQVIEVFFRQNDYPAAAAVIPTQNIADGDVRVIVFLGKIRNINIQGTRWFSESLLREKLRIEQGQVVKFSELDQAIGWTNNSPFRRVQVKLDPVPDTGEADLTIAVRELMPLRISASYDNTGNEAIGRERYSASVSYANLWGKDHQFSYQFLTTGEWDVFRGHGIDYRVPLPWRHYFQVSGSYMRALPEFYEGLFVQDAENINADMRYTIPLQLRGLSGEVYGAFNFKESNNNLAFGGTAVQATKTDIFQFTSGGSLLRRDKRGAWSFGGSVTISPGNVNSRNTDEAFDGSASGLDAARLGANATYFYVNLSVQRLLNLGGGWDLFTRGAFQASSANLLASEQMSIGGAYTIRGYNENVYSGDHGWLVSSDVMTPSWKWMVPKVSKTRGPFEARLLAFVEAGDTASRYKYPSDPERVWLASAGVGVRASLAHHFSLTADYGWQLRDLPYAVEETSRGHIRVTLAY